jgi:S-adenosyl-L-methionine hydrolase (adenosine-forming)
MSIFREKFIQKPENEGTNELIPKNSHVPVVVIANDFSGNPQSAGRGGKSDSALCKLTFTETLLKNGIKPPETIIVDDVLPFNVTNGAFIINRLARYMPAQSIIVGVVDPGVGTDRQGIIIETDKHTFIGPNNGLFYPTATNENLKSVHAIDNSIFIDSSTTFHGRDIFSRVAGELASGRTASEFGPEIPLDTLVPLHFQPDQILHIDAYGNYKINTLIPDRADSLTITMSDPVTIPLAKTFADVEVGKPLAYLGSDNLLEIAIREGNAFNFYKHDAGECLDIQWNMPIQNDP